MLRYHVAFYLPQLPGEMVVAEALDFPGAVTQGFDLPDARLMIAGALENLAQALLEEGKPLPVPSEDAHNPGADRIDLRGYRLTQGPLRSEAARIAGPPPPARMHSLPRRGVVLRSSPTWRWAREPRRRGMPKLTIASLERSAINSVFRRHPDPGAFSKSNLADFPEQDFGLGATTPAVLGPCAKIRVHRSLAAGGRRTHE